MGWIPCCGDSDDESSEIMEKIPLQETIYDPIKVKNPESLLGEGIYKGHLESFNQVVAIKNKNELQKDREFIHELLTSTLHHPNIVNPIHEYMSLGSLEEHLHDLAPGKKPLDWNTRMKIACGVANGLKYLHNKTEPPIIHRDLKCSNILLGEGYHPKLSGFGFARIIGPDGENTYVFTRDRQVMGSIGYCDPEHVKTGLLTPKSDVYSFGVVLLEIITGRKTVDDSEPIESVNLVAWARPLFVDIKRKYSKMADPMLQGQYPRRRLLQAIAVAAMCVLDQPQVRPGIADVCVALEHIASQTYDPNKHGVQSHSSLNKAV